MPRQAVSEKRERQYEHIKEGLREQGRSENTAEEIAARTVNKERARSGEARTASTTSVRDISSGRRGGLRSHRGAWGPDLSSALSGSEGSRDRGTIHDVEGPARAGDRPPLMQAPVRGRAVGRLSYRPCGGELDDRNDRRDRRCSARAGTGAAAAPAAGAGSSGSAATRPAAATRSATAAGSVPTTAHRSLLRPRLRPRGSG